MAAGAVANSFLPFSDEIAAGIGAGIETVGKAFTDEDMNFSGDYDAGLEWTRAFTAVEVELQGGVDEVLGTVAALGGGGAASLTKAGAKLLASPTATGRVIKATGAGATAGGIYAAGEGEGGIDRAVRMTPVLLDAARQWREDGHESVIHFQGKPISDIGTSFDAACLRAELTGVSPHTLKYTAVTWAFQDGITLEDASDYFATSVQTLLDVYRQHSPHHNQRAVAVMEGIGQFIFADNVAKSVLPESVEA